MPLSHVLATGERVLTRLARPADLAQVNMLHARCSPESLTARYHSGCSGLSAADWRRLTDPSRGSTWLTFLAVDPERPIALSHLLMTHDPLVAETALLVEDGWQSRGLGTLLVQYAVASARTAGCRATALWVGADNRRMIAIARRLGADIPRARSAVLDITVPTTAPHTPPSVQLDPEGPCPSRAPRVADVHRRCEGAGT